MLGVLLPVTSTRSPQEPGQTWERSETIETNDVVCSIYHNLVRYLANRKKREKKTRISKKTDDGIRMICKSYPAPREKGKSKKEKKKSQ